MKKIIINCILVLLIFSAAATAQSQQKNYFNASSPQDANDKYYGTVTVNADKHTVIINTIMASGENVKGLNVQINNGFVFKLAPAQNGAVLNYVGATLNIVLQPGDKATINFSNSGKGSATRHIYVAGEMID